MFKVKIESKDEWIDVSELQAEAKVVEFNSDAPKALEPVTWAVLDYLEACGQYTEKVALYMLEFSDGEEPIGYYESEREAMEAFIFTNFYNLANEDTIDYFDYEQFLTDEGYTFTCVDGWWFVEGC